MRHARLALVTATLLTLLAGPAAAQGDDSPGLPTTTAAPPMSPAQLDAIKRQLDAAPKTPGRAAMMGKLLKLAMALKNKQKVPTADLLALVVYLREANADKAADPAFEAALRQLEAGITKIQGAGENPDLEELKREFEGY